MYLLTYYKHECGYFLDYALLSFCIIHFRYNSADAVFLNHLSTGIKTTNSSTVWRYLIAYANLLRCIENLGIAVAYGIR